MIKKIIFTLSILFTLPSWALANVSITNTGFWKVNQITKKSELLGQAEIALTLPNSKPGAYTPTILGERLPVTATPTSTEEWHQLIFANSNKRMSTFEERAYQFGSEIRYFIEYATDEGAENMQHTMLLATSVDGIIYVFAFQNHHNTFIQYRKAVRNLFRDMQVQIKKGEKQ